MNTYDNRSSPEEEPLPNGTFEFGHHFEELWETFLRTQVTTTNEFVQNPVHIDFTEETPNGEDVQFSGSSDPVVIDRLGKPLLLTECKTTGSLHFIRQDNEPKTSHKAQIHAYARGMMEKFDMDSPPAMCVVYGERESLDVEVIFVDFDQDFWNEVCAETATETEYREQGILPPTVDEDREYICGYCPYSKRCGNYEPGPRPSKEKGEWVGDLDYYYDDTIADMVRDGFDDQPAKGFVPLKEYPEPSVIEHLQAHDDVKLTPTVATQYPSLVAGNGTPESRLLDTYGSVPQREVHDWRCQECGKTYGFNTITWDGDLDSVPRCQNCDEHLRGPTPAEADSN